MSGVAESCVRAKALKSLVGRYPLRTGRGEQCETAVRMVLARFGRAVRADIDQAAEFGDAVTVDVLSDPAYLGPGGDSFSFGKPRS
jgi:starvation-inducible DNA-binding protein